MNWHYQIIETTIAHLCLFCLLVLSFCASCNVGKPVVAHHKNIICIDRERDALLKFKNHIGFDDCGLMSSWGNPHTPDCCTWKGVTCSNQSGHVIGLHLRGDPYSHLCLDSLIVIPSLGELKRLEYLDLSSNFFNYMDIPSWIGSLVNLIHLNLSRCDFSGNIPKQLGNLTRLASLDLSNNDGLSAKSLNWLSRLTLLRDINLSGTHLSKAQDWFSIIRSLPLLEVLKMDYCELSTSLPSSSFLQSSNIRVISLSGNDFSSSGFQWLLNTSNYSSVQQSLEYLDLSNSFLQGLIPDAIGNYSSLKHLDLSNNLLQGLIPNAIGNLKFLTYLDLSLNLLSSIIPDALGNLEFLTYLDLSHNLLSSIIPDAITNLQSVEHIDLSSNSLSGTVPDAIGNLEFLKHLVLSRNSLSSAIPDAITNLQSLMHMDLSYNSLSGPIPSSLEGASSLSHLDLSNNQLEGTIPGSIVNLQYLGYLDLSSNHLGGDIPCKLMIRKPPYFAYFSYNNLSGSIPKHLSYLGPDPFQGNPSFHTDKIRGRCDKINLGLYVSIGLGFYTGFWAFCGTLTVKNSWRHAYFRFIDHILDNIYVTVAVNLARLRRNSRV